MITNPYSGKQIPGTGVLDLSVERKNIKGDQSQSPPTPTTTTTTAAMTTARATARATASPEPTSTATAGTSSSTNNSTNSVTISPNGKQAGKSIQWTNDLTHVFLRFMPEAHKKLTNDKEKPIKGRVWSELFEKFKETIIEEKVGDERFLDMVASEHLQNKWKDLKKRYAIISNAGKTSVDWPFYEQLEHILKHSNNNNSVHNNNSNNSNNDLNNSNNNNNNISTSSSSNASSSNSGHDVNSNIDDNEAKNPKTSNKNGKAKIGTNTTATPRETIEAQEPILSGIKRVASEFMDELKATLEEDRKLRRLDLEDERKKRQADTQLLLSSILDEMQRSSENSFRIMRTLIQSSFGESPPQPPPQGTTAMYYYSNNPQPAPPAPPPPHHHQQQQQQQSSPPPPQQPYYKHDYHQPHPQFQQYNPQKNHRQFR